MNRLPTVPPQGSAWPLGASLAQGSGPLAQRQGVNFAVHSRHATGVDVWLHGASAPWPLQAAGNGIWTAFVPDVGAGQAYTLRAHGPWAPHLGHRFHSAQPLIDPWGLALVGNPHPQALPTPAEPKAGFTPPPFPQCLVVDRQAELAAGAALSPRPAVADDRVVLYEVHVKSLTRLHPALPPDLRGSYAGLAHPAVLGQLQQLGVTTLCLLPVHQHLTERHLLERGLRNHWGYNPLQVFVPEPAYAACTGGQPPHTPAQAQAVRDEFRQLVDAAHRHGLQVVLDVVFNHTAEGDLSGPVLSWRGLDHASWYALGDGGQPLNFSGCGNTVHLGDPLAVRWVMDSLRWWVQAYGVDGFRFDLAPALGRQASQGHRFNPHTPLLTAMAQDPVLAGVHLIAEPWDLGPDGYHLGRFPAGWLEWNDRFRDTVRAFWLGHPCTPGELARRLFGSSDLFQHHGRRPQASVNLVTAHDGFTLVDLTAYTHKHNEANGEHNRDGHSHNLSANAGVEGPSADPGVQARRQGWQRALLATLFCAQGTPQLLAGDEMGHSQQGNNNAYCQDNPTTWLDWAGTDTGLTRFVAGLATLRRTYPGLRSHLWFTGQTAPGHRAPPGFESHRPLCAQVQGREDCHRSCPHPCAWAQGDSDPDVTWRGLDGAPMTPERWNNPQLRSLACVLVVGENHHPPTERLLLALHASEHAQTLALPPGLWLPVLDSAQGLAPGCPSGTTPAAAISGQLYLSEPTVCLLVQSLCPPVRVPLHARPSDPPDHATAHTP